VVCLALPRKDPTRVLASWDLSHTPTVRESILENWFVDFDRRLRIIIHISLDAVTKRVAPVPLLLYWLINLDVWVTGREWENRPVIYTVCEVGTVVNATLSGSVTFH
jgi:hypothetical protein